MEKKRKFILIIAVLGMIGTFLPWASAFGFTVRGTDGDGWITLALFAIGGAIAFFNGEKAEAIKNKVMTAVWVPAAPAEPAAPAAPEAAPEAAAEEPKTGE